MWKSHLAGRTVSVGQFWTCMPCNLFHARAFQLLPKKCQFSTRVLKFWAFYFQIPPEFTDFLISLSSSLQYNNIKLKHQHRAASLFKYFEKTLTQYILNHTLFYKSRFTYDLIVVCC